MKTREKFWFSPTEYDVDRTNRQFYEFDDPLGPRVSQAIKDVFNGKNCPFFTHISFGEGGFNKKGLSFPGKEPQLSYSS